MSDLVQFGLLALAAPLGVNLVASGSAAGPSTPDGDYTNGLILAGAAFGGIYLLTGRESALGVAVGLAGAAYAVSTLRGQAGLPDASQSTVNPA